MTVRTELCLRAINGRRSGPGHPIIPACRRHSDWTWLSLLAITFLSGPMRLMAQDTPTDISAKRCELQTIRDSPQQMRFVNSFVATATRDKLSDYYERDVLATDWYIEPHVDAVNPRLRFLLMTPIAPLVVDLMIYIDGKPFRSLQEAWIDAAVQPRSDGAEESKEDAKETPPVNGTTPPIAVGSARERLIQHAANSQSSLEREEARWLLAQWMPGSQILELDHSISVNRAMVDPLLKLLDGDGDGQLSESEQQNASKQFASADTNGDSDLDMQEILNALPKPRSNPSNTNRERVATRESLWFARRHDWNGEQLAAAFAEWYPAVQELTPEPQLAFLKRLGTDTGSWPTASDWNGATLQTAFDEMIADVVVRVDFGESPEHQTGVTLQSLRSEWGQVAERVHVQSDVLAIDLGVCHLEISAGQRTTRTSDGEQAGQVSTGAVIDGFAMYRQADINSDQRLTNNEQQTFVDQLKIVNSNANNKLGLDTFPVPIRIAVALGPHVHEMLAQPSPAAINALRQSVERPVPDWFVSMDTNQDKQLSPAEFIGTLDQFAAFDTNEDQQIDASEAATSDK